MEYTQNYALRKPGLNEYANVGDLNFNADKIDSQMKKNQDVDGEVYDPTSTSANAYEAGDYVINPDDGLMYVCNGTTYGTWDSTKWDHTTEFEEIQKAMASGGESELADLHDVEITTPTDGQAILYDPTSLKWHNSDLPDADVTKEASGNPIEFSDGAAAPLVKCVTQITGSQDLHGYSKPWVGGANVNLLRPGEAKTYTENGITFTSDGNGRYTVNGTATNDASCRFSVPEYVTPNGSTTTISFLNDGLGIVFGFLYQSVNVDTWAFSSLNRAYYGFSTLSNKNVDQYEIYVPSGNEVHVSFSPMFINGDVTQNLPPFSPYSNICPITAYTEGEIEVRGKNLVEETYDSGNINANGVVVANQSGYDLQIGKVKEGVTYTITSNELFVGAFYYTKPTTGSVSYNGSRLADVPKTFTSPITGYVAFRTVHNYATPQLEKGETATAYEPYTSTTHTTTYPSAIYRGSEDVVNGEVKSEWVKVDLGTLSWSYDSANTRFYTLSLRDSIKRGSSGWNSNLICSCYAGTEGVSEDGTISEYLSTGYVYIKDTRYDNTSDFTTAVTGQTIAYELATPTTSSVTPTNLPIKSLSGYNHIESSTGEMEIEYFPAKEQPLIDLIPEASNMHEYSTAEHAVGTWIDGETIYERSIDLGSFSIGSGGTQIIESATDIDLLIDYDGYVIESSIMYALPDPSIRIKIDSNKDLIFSGTANWNVTSGYLTIRYTKTSSNNRSLAKSAPQEETKEEQVEELKEEPTEEIKEEPEEEPVEEAKEEVKEEETKEEAKR